MILAAAVSATCVASEALGQRVNPEEGRKLFGQPAKPAKAKQGDAKGSWSILIEGFRGEDGESRARETLAKVQGEGHLREAYLERRGETWVIAYGRYAAPQDAAALADLEKIKAIKIGEGFPYAGAHLTPPQLAGTMPEYDLRNARAQFGKDARYTLQIGVYSREDKKNASPAELAEIRKTAEQAAVGLRREGEQAFYYHGPFRSTVTVGVFTEDDYDANNPDFQSARLKETRERYPYNLLNGKGVRRTMTMTTPQGKKTRVERIDPSMLVVIPKGDL